MAKKVKIGKVTDAVWNPDAKSVRFTMKFVNGMEMSASCPAGYNEASGMFIPSEQLQAKVRKFVGMVIYDQSGKIDPKKMTREDLNALRFNISLTDMDIGVTSRAYQPDVNSYLSRLF